MIVASYCRSIGFCEEDIAFLEKAAEDMVAVRGVLPLLYEAGSFFHKRDWEHLDAPLDTVARLTKLHRYTVDLLFVLLQLPMMQKVFAAKGISDEIFIDTLGDLTCKLNECKKMYGVVGTFVLPWYSYFFTGNRVKLGRLEFEYRVDRGEGRYFIHIPSGAPLSPSAVEDSFRKAYDFFGFSGSGKPLTLWCHSWFFYPPTMALFPENGNLAAFCRRFTVHESEENDYEDFWRIFYRDSKNGFENLPEESAFQKTFAAYFRAGGKMGAGLASIEIRY